MANVNVNFVERDPGQFHAPRFGPGLNFFTNQSPAVDPTLTVLAPVGASIGTQTPWQATLTLDPKDGTITRIIIGVSFPSGVYEIAYMDALMPDYSGRSTLIQTTPGFFTLSIIRNGGWPGSPRVFVHANTDRGGITR